MVIVQGQDVIDVIPEEHEADDQHDARKHFRQEAHGFQHFPESGAAGTDGKNDDRTQDGADGGGQEAQEETVSYGREGGFTVREKFHVMVEGKVSCCQTKAPEPDEGSGNDGKIGNANRYYQNKADIEDGQYFSRRREPVYPHPASFAADEVVAVVDGDIILHQPQYHADGDKYRCQHRPMGATAA